MESRLSRTRKVSPLEISLNPSVIGGELFKLNWNSKTSARNWRQIEECKFFTSKRTTRTSKKLDNNYNKARKAIKEALGKWFADCGAL